MTIDTEIIAGTFVAYMGVVLLIAYIAWRRTQNLADYILGGRSLNSWVTALSAQASDMSGWLLLGLPGLAYLSGLGSLWMVAALLIGTYLNWRIVANRLRRMTEELDDSLTLPDYFERRFKDDSRLLRSLSALFILVFFTFYTSSGFVAAGKLFEALFHLPYFWAVVLGSGTVITYTFIGGFLAVSWNDVLQGTLMFFALVIVAGMGLYLVGGFGGLHDTMNAVSPDLLDPFVDATGNHLGMIGIFSLLGWGLGYAGQPHILARFMAIRDPNEIAASRRIAMGWVTISLAAAALVGFTGLGVVDHVLKGDDSEKVFIFMSTQLFPPVIAGICLSGILAAVMSTASAQLLVSASAFAEDLYKGMVRRNAGRLELLWSGRLALVAIAVIAFVLALNPDSKVLTLVSHAWAGFGAAFGPTIILSLFWPRVNRAGAFTGIVVGGLTVLVWQNLHGGIFELYEIVPGFFFSLAAIVAVTLFTDNGSSAVSPEHG
ncbi:MAG: sodium/proline symporter PutP [Gammaproteobacteria bacterium]|jgi:sodium/proline symporter